jgi:hypothetical protein
MTDKVLTKSTIQAIHDQVKENHEADGMESGMTLQDYKEAIKSVRGLRNKNDRLRKVARQALELVDSFYMYGYRREDCPEVIQALEKELREAP